LRILSHPFPRVGGSAVLVVSLALGFGATSLSARTIAVTENEEAKLEVVDAMFGDRVGDRVSVDRDMAVLGAPHASEGGQETGVAYLFERTGGAWVERARLTGGDSDSGDRFGGAAAVDGERAVVGAFAADGLVANSGAVYVYERSGGDWFESQKLVALDGEPDDQFGFAVGVSANTIVVGAPGSDALAIDSGVAYVFFFNGSEWVQQSKLSADDGSAMDRFGESLAVEEDHLLIGSPFDDQTGPNAGAAYFFDRIDTTWFQFAKLRAGERVGEGLLGSATALSGDTALVGARGEDVDGLNAGAAYVFRNLGGGWNLEARLSSADVAPGDEFGVGVALDGDVAIVGARGADLSGEDAGAAYRFKRDDQVWTERERLGASDGALLDHLGDAVALSATSALVGAPDGGGTGAVYVYEGFRVAVSPDPLVPGSDATFTLTGGRPLATTFLAISLAGPGDTEVGVAGVKLDLANPFLGAASVESDADGVAVFVVSIPMSAGGRSLWFQGVQSEQKTQLGATVVVGP